MAGHEEADPAEVAKLKGLAKKFNSVTMEGRANVAKATYAGIALLGLFLYFKPKKATKTATS